MVDEFFHCSDVEFDGGEDFHGIGGAGGRGDGAGGGFGHYEAEGGDDGDDDGSDAISREATDAVFVYDEVFVPVDTVTDVDHGFGEVNYFFVVEAVRGAGGEECGDLSIGVSFFGDVFDY